jgi:hypothetical protein
MEPTVIAHITTNSVRISGDEAFGIGYFGVVSLAISKIVRVSEL